MASLYVWALCFLTLMLPYSASANDDGHVLRSNEDLFSAPTAFMDDPFASALSVKKTQSEFRDKERNNNAPTTDSLGTMTRMSFRCGMRRVSSDLSCACFLRFRKLAINMRGNPRSGTPLRRIPRMRVLEVCENRFGEPSTLGSYCDRYRRMGRGRVVVKKAVRNINDTLRMCVDRTAPFGMLTVA